MATVRNGPRKGKPCTRTAMEGATCCPVHLRNPRARENAVIRAEVVRWGLGDAHQDPGEVLLRLVSQSANRVALYSRLLEEAYDAAARLQRALAADEIIVLQQPASNDKDDLREKPAVQAAREDLERIFNHGGISALIGNTYSSTPTGGVYATGEAIRGLAELESRERERCATFAAKAIAAGLKEREVRIAERHGAMLAEVLGAVLEQLQLTDDQIDRVPDLIEAHLALVAG